MTRHDQDTTSVPLASLPRGIALTLETVDELNGAVIVHAGESLTQFERFKRLDAVGDRHSEEIGRLAAVGGREARLRGCGCDRVFGLIGKRNAVVQAADREEDQAVDIAGAHAVEIRTAGRTIAGRLEFALTGRRVRRRARKAREAAACPR